MTTEQQRKTLISDLFTAEMEHKVNTDDTYGNELLRVSARQDDALSVLGPDLPVQRMRVPDLDLEGSV
jgi:hypothetical protein